MREFFRETRNFDEATRYLKIERSNFYKMTREELFAITRTSKSFTVRIEHRKKDKKVSCKRLKGEIREQTWVRNFKGTLALLLIIIKNIAELLVYYKTET